MKKYRLGAWCLSLSLALCLSVLILSFMRNKNHSNNECRNGVLLASRRKGCRATATLTLCESQNVGFIVDCFKHKNNSGCNILGAHRPRTS